MGFFAKFLPPCPPVRVPLDTASVGVFTPRSGRFRRRAMVGGAGVRKTKVMYSRALWFSSLLLSLLCFTGSVSAQATLEGAGPNFAATPLPVVYESVRVEVDEQH